MSRQAGVSSLLRASMLLVLATIFLLAMPVFAQAPPSQDTFVSSATPKVNYGSGISLVVGPGTTSYVQFNLAGIPTGATVSKATLRLYVDAVATKGSFDVYQVNGGWKENTLTFVTPPPLLGPSATNNVPVTLAPASVNQFVLVDITALAQGWLNGSIPNNGVALALTSAAGTFAFDSKESLLTANGPELLVSFASSTGPQGPPGPQGAQGPQGPEGPQGPQGIQGPLGLAGATGAVGPQGPAGPAGADGTSFRFQGPFSGDVVYGVNDVVTYDGSTYIATIANQGEDAPGTNSIWSLMAQAGAPGAQGPAGPQGLNGLAGIQGPPGPTGATGAPGPTGATGAQGPAGPQGPVGSSGINAYLGEDSAVREVIGAGIPTPWKFPFITASVPAGQYVAIVNVDLFNSNYPSGFNDPSDGVVCYVANVNANGFWGNFVTFLPNSSHPDSLRSLSFQTFVVAEGPTTFGVACQAKTLGAPTGIIPETSALMLLPLQSYQYTK
jgi:Collagen triple helix repeat (20 copies)